MLEVLQKTLPLLTGAEPGRQRFLLAVSGGVDSVALAHLFSQAGWTFAIAHCNFQLRGEESDQDAAFVRILASTLQVPCFEVTFDTMRVMQERGGSIQMVARELRYTWLEEIRKAHDFDWIVTAHHLNDAVETLFINLMRSAGLKGLQGIPAVHGRVIRPLSEVSRQAILSFQAELGFSFREDSSNIKTDYLRNKIRHQVLPALESIQPTFIHAAAQSMQALQDAYKIYAYALEGIAGKVIRKEANRIVIAWPLLETLPAPETILFELLRSYGFNADQASTLWSMRNTSTGSLVLSTSHRCLIDRNQFILVPQETGQQESPITLSGPGVYQGFEGYLTLSEGDASPPAIHDRNSIIVDAQAVHFPLCWRRWKAGDRFAPLGMHGKHKKIQDFLTDLRVDRLTKARVTVLEDADGRILWVVGYRLDDHFKMDASQKTACLQLRYTPFEVQE